MELSGKLVPQLHAKYTRAGTKKTSKTTLNGGFGASYRLRSDPSKSASRPLGSILQGSRRVLLGVGYRARVGYLLRNWDICGGRKKFPGSPQKRRFVYFHETEFLARIPRGRCPVANE